MFASPYGTRALQLEAIASIVKPEAPIHRISDDEESHPKLAKCWLEEVTDAWHRMVSTTSLGASSYKSAVPSGRAAFARFCATSSKVHKKRIAFIEQITSALSKLSCIRDHIMFVTSCGEKIAVSVEPLRYNLDGVGTSGKTTHADAHLLFDKFYADATIAHQGSCDHVKGSTQLSTAGSFRSCWTTFATPYASKAPMAQGSAEQS